jgi:hypothetical protein
VKGILHVVFIIASDAVTELEVFEETDMYIKVLLEALLLREM